MKIYLDCCPFGNSLVPHTKIVLYCFWGSVSSHIYQEWKTIFFLFIHTHSVHIWGDHIHRVYEQDCTFFDKENIGSNKMKRRLQNFRNVYMTSIKEQTELRLFKINKATEDYI